MDEKLRDQLITAYLAADPGTRFAVRKLLDLSSPENSKPANSEEPKGFIDDNAEEMIFCNRVKEIRESKGLAQEDLCKEAGISLKTLLGIENGTSGSMKTKTAAKIAEALGVSATELFYSVAREREQ